MISHLTPAAQSTPEPTQDLDDLRTFMEYILRVKEEEVKAQVRQDQEGKQGFNELQVQEFEEQQDRIASLEQKINQLKITESDQVVKMETAERRITEARKSARTEYEEALNEIQQRHCKLEERNVQERAELQQQILKKSGESIQYKLELEKKNIENDSLKEDLEKTIEEQELTLEKKNKEIEALKKVNHNDSESNVTMLLDFNEAPNEKYELQDLARSPQICVSLEDYEVSGVLVLAIEMLHTNDSILNHAKDLTNTTGKKLIKMLKTCEDNKRNMELSNLSAKLLKVIGKGSTELQERACWAYKTLTLQHSKLHEIKETLAKEIEIRNINIDKPDEDKTKFLTPPTFTGTISAHQPHFFEYWSHMTDYTTTVGLSTEAAPLLVKASMRGEAKKLIDRKFGSKTSPTLKELKTFLKEEYGNEEQILQALIKCHKETGGLTVTMEPHTVIEKAETHSTLYDKAILLEQERPGIVTGSYAYLTGLREIFPQETLHILNRQILVGSTEEKIKALIEELNVSIRTAKDLRDRTEHRGTEGDQDGEYSDEDLCDEDEDQLTTYYTEMNPPSPLVKADNHKKCSLCYHSPSSCAGSTHKFSVRGNIEVDACPLLAPLDLNLKEKLLDETKYCKTCLYRKSHGECKPPPELHHLLCGASGCLIRWAVCSTHKQENLPKLERRKSELASHGILWIF